MLCNQLSDVKQSISMVCTVLVLYCDAFVWKIGKLDEFTTVFLKSNFT